VVEDVGPGVEDRLERVGVAPAVGDEHLDGRLGGAGPHGGDGGGEAGCTAVGDVVTGHARDHGVGQAHAGHRLGHPAGLLGVERERPAGVDQAEAAGPGAAVAQDHEGGGAVGPALVDVGAAGLLADGVQLQAPHEVLELAVLAAQPGLDPHPLGTPAGHFLGDSRFFPPPDQADGRTPRPGRPPPDLHELAFLTTLIPR
jgi:hypothetical protein